MHVLIHTHAADPHAIAASVALQRCGHRVSRNIGFDAGYGGSLTMTVDHRGAAVRHTTQSSTLEAGDVDVVWLRRPVRPRLSENLHPADHPFALGEWMGVIHAFHHACRDAFWINPLRSLGRAGNKPVQLSVALDVGLQVPPTCITNDPVAARKFLEEYGEVIFKPLRGAVWTSGDRMRGSYTSSVSLKDLDPPERAAACPGIYQMRIAKAYEVRAQFFGASVFAVRIDSAKVPAAAVDWRRSTADPALHTTPISLPEDVVVRCRRLMEELGIVSGAFDFIVTPKGEWVFLEVNEAGQFLFLELWCPDLTVLDAFVGFVQSRDRNFLYRSGSTPVRAAEVFQSPEFQEQVRAEEQKYGRHVHPGIYVEDAA